MRAASGAGALFRLSRSLYGGDPGVGRGAGADLSIPAVTPGDSACMLPLARSRWERCMQIGNGAWVASWTNISDQAKAPWLSRGFGGSGGPGGQKQLASACSSAAD